MKKCFLRVKSSIFSILEATFRETYKRLIRDLIQKALKKSFHGSVNFTLFLTTLFVW